jgi:acyl-coenzyme A synthetase/AMP-(fatty) acid ligase
VVLGASVAHLDDTPLQRLAADLRGHVRETIGGLAQPQAVAFLDELPETLGRRQLRQALAAVCSNARPGDVLHVTREQLLAALAASTGSVRRSDTSLDQES